MSSEEPLSFGELHGAVHERFRPDEIAGWNQNARDRGGNFLKFRETVDELWSQGSWEWQASEDRESWEARVDYPIDKPLEPDTDSCGGCLKPFPVDDLHPVDMSMKTLLFTIALCPECRS